MRRAAKVDANHSEIVAALRHVGASVADASKLGGGFPDLVVGFRGRTWLLEVKDGSKPPSARKLTPDQVAFRDGWRGHYAVVNSSDEAIKAVTGSIEAWAMVAREGV